MPTKPKTKTPPKRKKKLAKKSALPAFTFVKKKGRCYKVSADGKKARVANSFCER